MTQAEVAAAPGGGVTGRLATLAGALSGLTGWKRLGMAAALGALATFSAPPAYAIPVLLVAFPGLLWILEGVRSRRAAFLVGWAFGFGFFVPGLYWIAFALTVDLAAYFWMIPFAVAGLPAVLAVFTGLATLALHMLPLSGLARALAFAVLWGLSEWLRGHLFTGFPWQLVGYGWVAWAPVLQSVSVIGIYGLSLLTVAATALPAAAIDRTGGGWSRAGVAACLGALILFVGMGVAGAIRLTDTVHDVPDVRLRLVQPNIAQSDKWDRELAPQHFALHVSLSRRLGPEPVTHIIWPETAVPYAVGRDAAIREAIASATPPGGLVITGTPRFADAPRRQIWNSLAAIDDGGAIVGTFDKFHLVPFGEYVPLRGILPIEKITPGRLDFSPGPGPLTLDLPGLPPVSPLICYEVIFPGAVTADDDAERPRWLLNLTNDAWYGETAGPHQHFAITRTRAVEEGIPLVRVATTGISGVVDPHGRIVASLPLGAQGVVDSPLPMSLATPTPFARWRNAVFWAITLILVLATALRGQIDRES